jgi:two-component sensor histidine kinase
MKKKLLALLLSGICNSCLSQVPSYVPGNGLVAWYPFKGNAIDSSGNTGNNGAVHGASLTADRFGNPNSAYHFDSTYIIGACDSFPSGARTVSLWYRGANIGKGLPTAKGIFGYGGLNCGKSWFHVLDSNLFHIGMHCNENHSNYYNESQKNNSWHHWLVTNDGISETKFYIDGQLVFDTALFYNNTYVSGKNFIIGGIPGGNGLGYYTDANVSAFEGDIDDVGIWNRVLTPCEITQLFTAEILSITQYPVNDVATIGDTALFSVVSSNRNANFQWQTDSAGSGFHNIHEGTLYTGTTNDTLLVKNVTLGNNQFFRCIVSLPFFCADASATASLIVTTATPITFILAVAGVIALSSIFIFNFYKRKRYAVQKQRETTLSLKVSETEMKALWSQMNPHFLFNALSSIQSFLMSNQPEDANNYLLKFKELVRRVLENSMLKEITLQDDLKTLELYMELENIRLDYPFTFQFHIGDKIDPEQVLIPPLILQPFVENAIWHGLQPKADAGGYICISIQQNDNNLLCIVEDNGVGRGNSKSKEKLTTFKKDSLGIKLTEERLKIINKQRNTKAYFNIIDLFTNENKPCGTRVELVLPLN